MAEFNYFSSFFFVYFVSIFEMCSRCAELNIEYDSFAFSFCNSSFPLHWMHCIRLSWFELEPTFCFISECVWCVLCYLKRATWPMSKRRRKRRIKTNFFPAKRSFSQHKIDVCFSLSLCVCAFCTLCALWIQLRNWWESATCFLKLQFRNFCSDWWAIWDSNSLDERP